MTDISLGLGRWVNIRHCLFYNDVPQICIRLISLKTAGSVCFMVIATFLVPYMTQWRIWICIFECNRKNIYLVFQVLVRRTATPRCTAKCTWTMMSHFNIHRAQSSGDHILRGQYLVPPTFPAPLRVVLTNDACLLLELGKWGKVEMCWHYDVLICVITF